MNPEFLISESIASSGKIFKIEVLEKTNSGFKLVVYLKNTEGFTPKSRVVFDLNTGLKVYCYKKGKESEERFSILRSTFPSLKIFRQKLKVKKPQNGYNQLLFHLDPEDRPGLYMNLFLLGFNRLMETDSKKTTFNFLEALNILDVYDFKATELILDLGLSYMGERTKPVNLTTSLKEEYLISGTNPNLSTDLNLRIDTDAKMLNEKIRRIMDRSISYSKGSKIKEVNKAIFDKSSDNMIVKDPLLKQEGVVSVSELGKHLKHMERFFEMADIPKDANNYNSYLTAVHQTQYRTDKSEQESSLTFKLLADYITKPKKKANLDVRLDLVNGNYNQRFDDMIEGITRAVDVKLKSGTLTQDPESGDITDFSVSKLLKHLTGWYGTFIRRDSLKTKNFILGVLGSNNIYRDTSYLFTLLEYGVSVGKRAEDTLNMISTVILSKLSSSPDIYADLKLRELHHKKILVTKGEYDLETYIRELKDHFLAICPEVFYEDSEDGFRVNRKEYDFNDLVRELYRGNEKAVKNYILTAVVFDGLRTFSNFGKVDGFHKGVSGFSWPYVRKEGPSPSLIYLRLANRIDPTIFNWKFINKTIKSVRSTYLPSETNPISEGYSHTILTHVVNSQATEVNTKDTLSEPTFVSLGLIGTEGPSSLSREAAESRGKTYLHKLNTILTKSTPYTLVVPRSQSDLMLEGNSLNNCCLTYYEYIHDGDSIVLFLRSKGEPTKSLYTLELSTETGNIIQFSGKNDSLPDSKVLMEVHPVIPISLKLSEIDLEKLQNNRK